MPLKLPVLLTINFMEKKRKFGRLNLNKETISELSQSQAYQIKGGTDTHTLAGITCNTSCCQTPKCCTSDVSTLVNTTCPPCVVETN